MSSNLALKIKHLINENSLSVQGLEKKAGLKINAVRNILTGQSKKPSAETLMAIAKALNCSIEDLLGEHLTDPGKQYLKETEFRNYKLLEDASRYVISFYKERGDAIKSKEFISLVQEIYLYSHKNKEGDLDEKFARWILGKNAD